MSNVKVKCELFKRTNESNNFETFDFNLQLTNFTRDDLLSFLTELHGSISKFTNITPPDEAS
ncbi:hypothetical protein [Nostoc sp. LPT]|uniref:hypothetical protein n=1 Tax=Nostoc sp. LPT TaxID=2815387 RepID=UPI001DBDEF2D|nr:hypothetical protein [Nostoc sp. LPT]MBN4004772.1 hypothetical protein [Nostoc sp. LPT]